MKRKLLSGFAGIILVGILIITFNHVSFRHYPMPAGYKNAGTLWAQLGLQVSAGPFADGTPSHPYDVIVWGSDPEGIAAAVSAARNGLHTLLIDHRDRVGGLFILGELNFIDINYDARQELVTRGIFEEFYRKVGGFVFDLETGERVFNEMLDGEPLISLQLNHELVEPVLSPDRTVVQGIKVRDASGTEKTVYGRIVIDASQDADLAEMAGVPFTKGMEDIGLPGKYQAATLMFRLTGINWPVVMWETNVADRRATSHATLKGAWGYDNYIKHYQPENPSIDFRGFNMARQKNGEVVINGLLIYGVDPFDDRSKREAMEAAQTEAYRFVEFARANLPGFRNAQISGFARELYIRESNHMSALYRLTLDDVLENRDFPDRIGYGGYPVDIQALDRHMPGIAIGAADKYAIPLRCLVPPNFHNLLVVGRSAGFDPLAHGSARIVGVGIVAGQAAGVVSAYSLATQKSFQEIPFVQEDMNIIQHILASQGAFVAPSDSKPPEVAEHPHYEAMKKLRRLGMAAGGYKNRYQLDEPMTVQTFLNILFNSSVRTLNIHGQSQAAEQCYYVVYPEEGHVTKDNITEVLDYFFKFNPHLRHNDQEALALFISTLTAGKAGAAELPRGELYEIIARYLVSLEQE